MPRVPFGDSEWWLTAADLFILDKWDRESSQSEAEQYDEIITEWIEGGPEPRERYDEQLSENNRRKHRGDDTFFSHIGQADIQLLARLRPKYKGWDFTAPALRICYDEGTDEAFHRSTFGDDYPEETDGLSLSVDSIEVFNDASLFNFQDLTSGRGWRQFLYTFPHIFTSGNSRRWERQRKSWREAMATVQRRDAEESPLSREDELDVLNGFHRTMVSHHMVVCDRTTLKETGSWLCVFYDDWGRLVRSSRVYGPEDKFGGHDVQVLLWDTSWDDMPFFTDADIGPGYHYQDLRRFGPELEWEEEEEEGEGEDEEKETPAKDEEGQTEEKEKQDAETEGQGEEKKGQAKEGKGQVQEEKGHVEETVG